MEGLKTCRNLPKMSFFEKSWFFRAKSDQNSRFWKFEILKWQENQLLNWFIERSKVFSPIKYRPRGRRSYQSSISWYSKNTWISGRYYLKLAIFTQKPLILPFWRCGRAKNMITELRKDLKPYFQGAEGLKTWFWSCGRAENLVMKVRKG